MSEVGKSATYGLLSMSVISGGKEERGGNVSPFGLYTRGRVCSRLPISAQVDWAYNARVIQKDGVEGYPPLSSKKQKGVSLMQSDITFIGVDVSKNHFNVAISNSKGTITTQMQFPMSLKGYRKFLELFNSSFDIETTIIGIESSGPYHINLLDFLIQNNLKVILINPLMIFNLRKSFSLRKTKTDKLDAAYIARAMASYPLRASYISPKVLSLRKLSRCYEELSHEITAIKNRIRQSVAILFQALERKPYLFSLTCLKLLERFPSALSVLRADHKEIEMVLNEIKDGSGKNSTLTSEEFIKLAEESHDVDMSAEELNLRVSIRRLLFLLEQAKDLRGKIVRLAWEYFPKEMEILTSVKGIGELSAGMFISEIGDIRRFRSGKQLVAYAGIDTVIYESGKYRARMGISKRGNRHLRRILYLMMTNVVSNKDSEYVGYFLKKRKEGKAFKVAIFALANKFLRRTYAKIREAYAVA